MLTNYHSPLKGGYHLELNMIGMLDEEDVSKYRILIVSMNWIVTLGELILCLQQIYFQDALVSLAIDTSK